MYSASVSPILGLRFNNLLGTNSLSDPSQSLGLKMEVSDGIFSGFDVSDGDFRIFVQQSFATFGIGTNDEDEPQFTVGGSYSALDNLNISLEYVINRLTDANDVGGANTGVPYDDQLRIGLIIIF